MSRKDRKKDRMLLIIEGADLVGKTVLAAAMVGEAARRGFTSLLMKAGPPRSSNAVDEYGMPLTAAKAEIESSETLVICDRWHLGELFYGPLLRGRSIVSARQAELFRLRLAGGGAATPGVLARGIQIRARVAG